MTSPTAPATPSAPGDETALPATYDAQGVEAPLYARWTDAGIHRAPDGAAADGRTPFTVMMPPPNVTAILHVGHGLNNTVQDVLVRWRRMAGDATLWLPGTDHAGIATQNIVEKQLAAEGTTKAELGRDAFVARTAQFVERTGGQILGQLRAIGASADWSRTRYTLSPELSRAVTEAFVRLFDDGLIYRGHRVIHWCSRCLTSLSDEEAEFADTAGKLYHIRYPLADDPAQGITVATTRPETLLGDVAVAVHPDDERYASLVGRELLLPVADVRIPVIADAYVDREFGSGAVKITPAHDPNDFEVGRRHALAMPVIMSPAGHMANGADAGARVPERLQGVDRFAARERIVAELREAGLLVAVNEHAHAVRHCYRCDTVVEPRLSDQWFVRMQPLAEPALAAVRDGRVRILPERWEAVYVNWLEGIRDWNISRQLWWGHRVPVYYCDACGAAPRASRTPIVTCPDCGAPARQDEDVLDTWFSSWLWPISTLGWPDETSADLRAHYPGDMLVTAPEILFFWVARMIMSGMRFMDGRVPFHTVYLHGTVRDIQGRKMSKSLGNGIDPLDVVQRYGADALRWTLVSGMGLGVDVLLDHEDLEKSFAPGRNFCTKLWNIGRFLLTRVGTAPVLPVAALDASRLTVADRWILARLDAAIRDCDAALGPARPGAGGRWTPAERTAGLRLDAYADAARRYVWNELADWYLEAAKPRLANGGDDAETVRAVLAHAFDGGLRLLQPIIPFVTETLWAQLPPLAGGDRGAAFLATAAWPGARQGVTDAGDAFALAQAATQAVRQLRSEYGIAPGQRVAVTIVPVAGAHDDAASVAGVIATLARADVTIADAPPAGASAQAVLAGGTEVVLPLAGLIDVDKECQRLRDELAQVAKLLEGVRGRLANEGFVSRAKPEVVEGARAQERDLAARAASLAAKVEALCGGR